MKRTVAILAGLATLGSAIYFGQQLWGQQPPGTPQPPAAPRPTTKIAIVNMVQVLKGYQKFLNMEGEIRKLQTELEHKLEPYRASLINLRTEYNNPATAQARREAIERETRKLQAEAQIAEEDAKKELMKRSGDSYVIIYRDVEDAVNRLANANGYEMVLFYNDAITPDDKYHPQNVQRKLLQPAAIMPMYINPGMDVSAQLIASLNAMYPGNKPATPGAPTAPATPPAGTAPGAPPAAGQPH